MFKLGSVRGRIKLTLFTKKLGLPEFYPSLLIKTSPKIKEMVENNITSENNIVFYIAIYWAENKKVRLEDSLGAQVNDMTLHFGQQIRQAMSEGKLPLPKENYVREWFELQSPT